VKRIQAELKAQVPDSQTRVFHAIRYALLFAAGIAVLVYLLDVVLVIFAGGLLAVLFATPSRALASRTGLGYGWCLAATLLLLAAILTSITIAAAPGVARQVDELTRTLPQAIGMLRERLDDYGWVRRLLDRVDTQDVIGQSRGLFQGLGLVFSALTGAIATFLVILFLGLYGAVDPQVYRRGFLRLLPSRHRERAGNLLDASVSTLKWWLLGKLVGMALIGVGTAVGLWLLGVPLAPILALIAALLTFIPNLGPILAAIPAVMVGMLQSTQQALFILGLYVAVQFVESYIVTPIVQQRTVSVPPALGLASQLVLGVVGGAMGIALATPLAAVGIALLRSAGSEPEQRKS
jgi:predicted PurR-regulated permease PerM